MRAKLITYDVRCVHGTPLQIDDDGCSLCIWTDYLERKQLPYKVRYKGTHRDLKAGETYTAIHFIKNGKTTAGDSAPCFLLQTTTGDATRTGYSVRDFEVV